MKDRHGNAYGAHTLTVQDRKGRPVTSYIGVLSPARQAKKASGRAGRQWRKWYKALRHIAKYEQASGAHRGAVGVSSFPPSQPRVESVGTP